MMKGERYTQAWFKTKREAKEAEQRKRDDLNKPISTDMAFFDLLNLRLDEVKQRLSHKHYIDTLYRYILLVPPARIRRATPGLGILCSIP